MKRNIFIYSLLLFSCTATAQTSTTNMNKLVLAVHHKIMQSVGQKNGDSLQSLIHGKFRFTDANAMLWTKEKFIKGFVLNPAIQFPLFEASEQEVTVEGAVAVVTAVVNIRLTRSAGAPVEEFRERTTETYVLSENEWKLMAMQATFIKK